MSELYELPDGWEWRKLEELCEILDSKRKPISQKDRISGDYPYYGTSGVLDYVHDYIFDERLVLIGEDGAKWGANENSSFIADGKYWVNNHVHIIRPDKKKTIDSFLIYYLNASDLSDYITGATVKKLNQKKLKSIPIPLPFLQEQKRIVAKLDSLFEKIDSAIALHQQNIDEAEKFMGTVLNEVFGELEEKYEKKELKDIVNNLDGKRIPIKASDRENIQGKYPYYGASGIIDYVENYIFDGEYLLISEDGANLTVRKYPIAFIAKGKFWVNNHAHIVVAKKEVSTNRYMEYAFAYTDISLYITGSAQPKMSQKKMNIIQFVIPPLNIQQKTVTYLDQISQKTEQLKKVQQEKLQNLKALKASILDRAFRGKI